MDKTVNFYCPACGCGSDVLFAGKNELRCANGHSYSYAPGTTIPVFSSLEENANEYALTNAAEIHDNALKWLFATVKTDEAAFRRRLVSRLNIKRGSSILVIGAGAGNDLPYLAECMDGEGAMHAQDISKQMLLTAAKRYGENLNSPKFNLSFSVSDATNLPFNSNAFDAAYHFGGINLFSSISAGIQEMNRVVKPGGRVLFGDEGLAPWLKSTELGKMLIKNNPLYAYDAPLRYLPETARRIELTWELENCFYVIAFSVSDAPLAVDIDVPHVGRRGGSIRTRYFGELEGVTPALRDRLYEEAARSGMSRVAYLEQLLGEGMKGNACHESP